MKKIKKKKQELHRQGKKWTQREEDLLEELYPDMFNFELSERFGRTASAIGAKAHLMGTRKNWVKYSSARFHDDKPWSQKEIERLEKLYPQMPITKLRRHFPKRSNAAISRKASLLKLTKNYLRPSDRPNNSNLNLWREQKELLIKLYPTTSNKELAKLLGRTKTAILGEARQLGLHKACYILGERSGLNHRFWHKKEDALVRKLYPMTLAKDIAARLGRTTKAVTTRAEILGVRKDPEKFMLPARTWSDEDIKTLRQLRQKGYSRSQIAEIIGKSPDSIKFQTCRQERYLGLSKRYAAKGLWTVREIKILKKYYKQWTNIKIAKKLGKTASAVGAKASKLGLKK